jgi:hypothetical protein
MKTFTYFSAVAESWWYSQAQNLLALKIKKSLQQYQKDFRKLRYQPYEQVSDATGNFVKKSA